MLRPAAATASSSWFDSTFKEWKMELNRSSWIFFRVKKLFSNLSMWSISIYHASHTKNILNDGIAVTYHKIVEMNEQLTHPVWYALNFIRFKRKKLVTTFDSQRDYYVSCGLLKPLNYKLKKQKNNKLITRPLLLCSYLISSKFGGSEKYRSSEFRSSMLYICEIFYLWVDTSSFRKFSHFHICIAKVLLRALRHSLVWWMIRAENFLVRYGNIERREIL